MKQCYYLANWKINTAADADRQMRNLFMAHLCSRHMEIDATTAEQRLSSAHHEACLSTEKFDEMRETSGGMYTIMYPVTLFHFQQRAVLGLEKPLERTFPSLTLSKAVNRQTCDTKNDLFSLVKDIRDNENNIVRLLQKSTGASIWDTESYFQPFVAVVNRCFNHYTEFRQQSGDMWFVEREACSNLLYGMYEWQTHHPRYILGKELIELVTNPNRSVESKRESFVAALNPELIRLRKENEKENLCTAGSCLMKNKPESFVATLHPELIRHRKKESYVRESGIHSRRL